jgi:hypothetical protein
VISFPSFGRALILTSGTCGTENHREIETRFQRLVYPTIRFSSVRWPGSVRRARCSPAAARRTRITPATHLPSQHRVTALFTTATFAAGPPRRIRPAANLFMSILALTFSICAVCSGGGASLCLRTKSKGKLQIRLTLQRGLDAAASPSATRARSPRRTPAQPGLDRGEPRQNHFFTGCCGPLAAQALPSQSGRSLSGFARPAL